MCRLLGVSRSAYYETMNNAAATARMICTTGNWPGQVKPDTPVKLLSSIFLLLLHIGLGFCNPVSINIQNLPGINIQKLPVVGTKI